MSGFGIFPPHDEQYGAVDTYRIAAEWLDGHGVVWDWGCGYKFAERFFRESAYQGIDAGLGADLIADLADVDLQCDCILMRHILENNESDWPLILDNAVRSFKRRMALVTFTEFADRTHVYKREQYEFSIPYLRFRKADLTERMGGLLVGDVAVRTTHPEHVFFLERR